MSLITHRCTKCGHPDFWRLANKQNPDQCPGVQWGVGCRVCPTECVPGPPELMDTFDHAGRPVETVAKPGEWVLRMDIPTHDCDECRALYAELTGAAA